VSNQDIETKLSAARTKLILDKPFLGALVLRLPMKEGDDEWCRTTATDAKHFYYNPDYIENLTLPETQFVLAHEALHCALSHFARRGHRMKHRWDLSCDYAINPLLIADGLEPPPGSLYMDQFSEMTAEEIYPMTKDLEDKETLDSHVYDKDNDNSGKGTGDQEATDKKDKPTPKQPQNPNQSDPNNAPAPLTPDEQETLSIQWQQRMAGAAQMAMQAGKMGGSMARMIDHLLQPQLPWRMLLARYLSSNARNDYSYMRPSRRAGDFLLPSLRSQQIDLVVALDTSGSLMDQEIASFVSEIDALKGQLSARITLLACDSEIKEGSPWIFEPWESFQLSSAFTGGGGTTFIPVFDWVKQQGLQPESLIYFTDAQGKFPEHEPYYPVIWLIKGKQKVPWGQRVQLN